MKQNGVDGDEGLRAKEEYRAHPSSCRARNHRSIRKVLDGARQIMGVCLYNVVHATAYGLTARTGIKVTIMV